MIACVQLLVGQDTLVLFHWGGLKPLDPQPEKLKVGVVAEVQVSALHFVESHTFGICPWIQPDLVFL